MKALVLTKYNYSDEFLNEMINAYHKTREVRAILHGIDWVLSGDDNEADFLKNLAGRFKSK